MCLVMNPLYGDPIGKFGSRSIRPPACHYNKVEAETGFYTKLEASMKKEGIRNPIFCQSIEEGTFCRYGTSRLLIAKKLSMPIPTIVADYVGRWDNLEELHGEEEVLSKFTDNPELLEINAESMRFDRCPQVHLDA